MGDYRDKSGSERVDAPEKIDLTNVMLDVYHGVKRLWWLFIGLIIICAVQSYFSVSTSYQSKYVASATVSVTSVGGMDYVDADNSAGVLGAAIYFHSADPGSVTCTGESAETQRFA